MSEPSTAQNALPEFQAIAPPDVTMLPEAVSRQQRLSAFGSRSIPVVIIFILFLLGWEGAVKLFHVSAYLVPTPTAVGHALWQILTVRPFQAGGIWTAIWQTYSAALIG